jgi:hypothetical protein
MKVNAPIGLLKDCDNFCKARPMLFTLEALEPRLLLSADPSVAMMVTGYINYTTARVRRPGQLPDEQLYLPVPE